MSGKTLTAPELLEHRGIRAQKLKKWDDSAKALPTTGQKQFEPNNSWLQNKQIEKGLEDRKNLLGIERVERSSQLAIAEWIPEEGRARVTKKSGQDWTNFGMEENCQLYLIPEEALILLELNCLELTWNGVAMSIQQAYTVLLDSDQSTQNTCTFEEYRVYSQLVRQGYRLQRYKSDDDVQFSSSVKKKKTIHDPRTSFAIARDHIEIDITEESSTNRSMPTPESSSHVEQKIDEDLICIEPEKDSGSVTMLETETNGHSTNPMIMKSTPSGSDSRPVANQRDDSKKLLSEIYDNGVENLPGPSNAEYSFQTARKNCKLQIISDETFLGDIHVLSKWPGAKIPKLLSTTREKSVPSCDGVDTDENATNDATDSTKTSFVSKGDEKSENKNAAQKRPQQASSDESPESKKVKYEVIELSDDDIEVVPPRMTRMEMLNLMPNFAQKSIMIERFDKKYCPTNARPRRDEYQFHRQKLFGNPHNTNGNLSHQTRIVPFYRGNPASQHSGESHHRNDINASIPNRATRRHLNTVQMMPLNIAPWNRTVPPFSNVVNFDERLCIPRREPYVHGTYVQRTERDHYFHNAITFNHPRINQHHQQRFQIHQQRMAHRRQWMHGRNLRSISTVITRQELVHVMPRNSLSMQNPNPFPNRNSPPTSQRSLEPRCSSAEEVPQNGNNRSAITPWKPSFKKAEGCKSWRDMKNKWLEAKTITIDDDNDDVASVSDDSEIAVLKQTIRPLVNHRNTKCLADVYKNLQIIKRAPHRTVRKSRTKKYQYNISYNLFSSSQHFKKSNPGPPLYRVVIFRSKDTAFIELADVLRLQQEVNGVAILMACVSQTSITYSQFGTADIPNI